MEELTIYKFQLETIIEALRLASKFNDSIQVQTHYDRQVRQAAYEFAKNALKGKKDIEVKYM